MLRKIIQIVANSLRASFKTLFTLLAISYRRLGFRIMASDFLSIGASIGFVVVPAFASGIIFLFLPQGRDTFQLILEHVSVGKLYTLAGVWLGIFLWSIFSETAVRYAVAISDNSGRNLSDHRVDWRKTAQRILAGFFLCAPGLTVITGFFISLMTARENLTGKLMLAAMISIFSILVLEAILVILYFHKFGAFSRGKPKSTIFGRRSLDASEQGYVNKLYGIYQNYIFSLPKPSSFLQPYSEALSDFIRPLVKQDRDFRDSVPQNEKVLKSYRLVPAEFQLISASKIDSGKGEFYKWEYKIPKSFYKTFHGQVKRIALISLVIVIVLAFVPVEWRLFQAIGPLGLVSIAFACYTGLYCGLLYLDKVVVKRWYISLRTLMVILILCFSYMNRDHPVRVLPADNGRPQLRQHFISWLNRYKTLYRDHADTSVKKYPVVFICAEGGAFRTGAYTTLFLLELEKALLARKQPIDLKNSVYAMSGVSGGAVGLGYFHAVSYRQQFQQTQELRIQAAKDFYMADALSPVLGKMLFGEFVNLFLPLYMERFDRAAALEKSWEQVFGRNFMPSGNTYSAPFITDSLVNVKGPVLNINTTEAESGLPCLISNVAQPEIELAQRRDLLSKGLHIRFSTAINFSTRFPFISPAGMIATGERRLHYLDGGYYENTGAASMLELIDMLRTYPEFSEVTPVVVNLLFGEEEALKEISFLNDPAEVLAGLLKARSGRGTLSRTALDALVRVKFNGEFIDSRLTPLEKQVPMNWVLSDQSMQYIMGDIHAKLTDTSGKAFFRRFLRADLHYPQSDNR